MTARRCKKKMNETTEFEKGVEYIKKETAFERGREYESLRHSTFFYLFLGYGCTIGSILFSFTHQISGSIFLLIFGLASLYVGYCNKKELKQRRKE